MNSTGARLSLEATDHILLVHGTRASLSSSPSGSPSAEADAFSTRLVRHLDHLARQSPSPTRRFTVEHFHWSGRNSHAERITAGARLAERIKEILTLAPEIRVHVVAHSHGGNVLLSAYESHISSAYAKGWSACRSVFARILRGVNPATAINDVLVEACGRDLTLAFGSTHAADIREALDQWLNKNASRVTSLDATPDASTLIDSEIIDDEVADLVNVREMHFQRYPGFDHVLGRFCQSWIRAWLRSPHTNRLGALVFCGTPFLIKRWPASHDPYSRRIRWRMMLHTYALMAALPWALVITTWVALTASVMLTFSWSPWWTLFLDPVWFVPAILLALLIAHISVRLSTPLLTDVNLYFRRFITLLHDTARNPGQYREASASCSNRAFVLNSETADEALLALRSEPILRALFRPQLRSWIRGGAPALLKPTSWHRAGGASLWIQGLNVANRVRRVAGMIVHRVLGGWLEERGLHFVSRVVMGAGLGLDGVELSGTQIEVSHHPKVSYLETMWRDVTLECAESHLHAGPPAAEAGCVPRTLRGEDDSKELVSAALREQYGGGGDRWVTFPLFATTGDHESLRMAAAIERMEQIFGGIPWRHSVYHKHDLLIGEIADFILRDVHARVNPAFDEPWKWPYRY